MGRGLGALRAPTTLTPALPRVSSSQSAPCPQGGAEGDCPTHSGTGRLLSSRDDPRPPNPPPGHMGPQGRRREAGEMRRGRREGPSQTPDPRSRRGEEGVCPAHSSPGSLLGPQGRSSAL